MRSIHRELDASVEASEPHDFAVRSSAVRQRHRHVHRIPPHVRDDRETPLREAGRRINKTVSTLRRSKIFLPMGLDTKMARRPDGQITWRCSRALPIKID